MKKTLNKNLKIRINFVTWFLRRLPHFSAPHRSPDQSIIAIGTQPFTSPSLSLLLIGWLSHWPQWSTYRSTPAGPLSVGPLVAEISNRLGRLVPWIPSQINVSDVGRRERGENRVLLQVRRVFRKLKTKELNHNHVSATSSLLFFEQIFFSDRKLWFSSSIHEKHCVSQQDQLHFSLFPCLNLVFPSNPFFFKNTKFSFTFFKYVVLGLSSFVSVSWNLDFSVWTLVWGSDVSVPVCNPLCAACLSTRRPSTCAIDRTSMFACEYVTFTGDISTGPSFMSGGILGKVDGGSMPLLLVKTDTSLWLCIIITQQNWLQLCTGVKVRRQASVSRLDDRLTLCLMSARNKLLLNWPVGLSCRISGLFTDQ